MLDDRTSKRLHRLVCDREVWVWLLRGIEIFSEEKVKELARFGSKGSPEMKAEVVKSAGGKMKPGMRPLITIKVGVQGWGDTLDTFEVDGDAMTELATRGTPSLPRVASIVGSCLNMQEVYCRTSVMSVPVLSEIADHLDRVGGSLEHLELWPPASRLLLLGGR